VLGQDLRISGPGLRRSPRAAGPGVRPHDDRCQDAWQGISDEARRENEDGFRAYLEPVSDPAFDHLTWDALRAAMPPNGHGARVLFIADSATYILPDHPVLVVDLLDDTGGPPFRSIPPELWAVENNLNTANMDWDDFAGAVDEWLSSSL